MQKGILAGGNWIIDQVKIIDNYPAIEELVNILEEYSSNGGSAYNILKDLYKLEAPFSLEGIGLVGDDERGNKIIEECKANSINTSQIRKTNQVNTSYTDVMSLRSSGKRTFFYQRGANALLNESHFDFTGSSSKIFHLGYLLLLDSLDDIAPDGSTGAARVLKKAKEAGFITSADLVSENSGRFKNIVPPALPFIDYLFVNEFESSMLTGIDTTDSTGEIHIEGCYKAASKIIDMGVREWVIIHFPHGVTAVNKKKERIFQPTVNLPIEKIAGAVGAGDAFAAGVLMGIHEEWDMKESLVLGVCAAATSLLQATCSDSILPFKECLALPDLYGYRSMSSNIIC